MGLFSKDSSLGIGDLTIGVSDKGMSEYKNELKIKLLDEVSDQIKSIDAVKNSINSAWQGVSRDAFLDQLDKSINDICCALKKEYNNVEAKMDDVEGAYRAIDNNLMNS